MTSRRPFLRAVLDEPSLYGRIRQVLQREARRVAEDAAAAMRHDRTQFHDVDVLIELPPGTSEEDGAQFAEAWRALAPGADKLIRTGGREFLVRRYRNRCWHGPDDVL